MVQYLNFELQISELASGVYLSQVIASPTGETPAIRFRLPFQPDELSRILDILSGSRQYRKATRDEIAKQFGEALFQAVFAGDVGKTYQESCKLASQPEMALRVRLSLSRAGEIANLPWEFLREPGVDYLALSRNTPLLRYTQRVVQRTRMQARLPLRILVMISAPLDLPDFDEAAERANLDAALARLKDRRLVEIEYLEDASLRTLQRVLREREFDVFHYIGHSAYNPETGTGYLALEDPQGSQKAYMVRGEALARELFEEPGIRLVVLNSCEGAQADTRDPFSGVASSLVQRGIPAVVAMQFEITDRAAIAFSEEFYRAVAEGFPIEAAMSEGRRAILGSVNNTEWATPVLFLFNNDEQPIFSFPRPDELRLSRIRAAQLVGGLAALLVILLIAGALLLGNGSNEAEARIPPATLTPIPDVDLVVREVSFSPRNPQPGEFVAVFVDVENRGSDPAPAFTYEWQPSLFRPQTVIQREVEGLAPGGVLHDNFVYRFGWWGAFITETRLDTTNLIIETSEQNSYPRPVVIDRTRPLVVDFSEPLPDGSFIRQTQPVPEGAFAEWGFALSATSNDPACEGVIPWFKFVGIGRVALGTGLPDAPAQCADATLLITFLPRTDNNPGGISGASVRFAPGGGEVSLIPYSDDEAKNELAFLTAANSRREGVALATPAEIGRLQNIFALAIDSEGGALAVSGLEFAAP